MNSFPGRPRCLNYQAKSIRILQNTPITLLFISLLRSRRSDSRLELRTQQRRVLPPPLQPRTTQNTEDNDIRNNNRVKESKRKRGNIFKNDHKILFFIFYCFTLYKQC